MCPAVIVRLVSRRLSPAWRDRRKRSALWRADHRQGASLGSGPLVRDAQVAKALTLDEARRIASNIAKLTILLGKKNSTLR